MRSRPTRARGLKRVQPGNGTRCPQVAPHAGAWIETPGAWRRFRRRQVAPHAGAWIETCVTAETCIGHVGRAPRGRVD